MGIRPLPSRNPPTLLAKVEPSHQARTKPAPAKALAPPTSHLPPCRPISVAHTYPYPSCACIPYAPHPRLVSHMHPIHAWYPICTPSTPVVSHMHPRRLLRTRAKEVGAPQNLRACTSMSQRSLCKWARSSPKAGSASAGIEPADCSRWPPPPSLRQCLN